MKQHSKNIDRFISVFESVFLLYMHDLLQRKFRLLLAFLDFVSYRINFFFSGLNYGRFAVLQSRRLLSDKIAELVSFFFFIVQSIKVLSIDFFMPHNVNFVYNIFLLELRSLIKIPGVILQVPVLVERVEIEIDELPAFLHALISKLPGRLLQIQLSLDHFRLLAVKVGLINHPVGINIGKVKQPNAVYHSDWALA